MLAAARFDEKNFEWIIEPLKQRNSGAW